MKIDKKKSIAKVDGPVARAIAIGTYITKNPDSEVITVETLGILSAPDNQNDSNSDDEEILDVEDITW